MNYLGYTKEEFEKAISTLEKISKYINGGFLVVGGLALRTLFPDFEGYQENKINDLDLVFYPAKEGKLLKPDVKDEFYIGYIAKEDFGKRKGFYFAVIDKDNFVKVDLFMPERDIRVQEIEINDKKYNCPIKEEIYLNNLRDFWYWTHSGTPIDPKYVDMLKFLEAKGKLNNEVIEEIWSYEKDAIKDFCSHEAKKNFGKDKNRMQEFCKNAVDRNFSSFGECRNAVWEEIRDNEYLIQPKRKKSTWEYPINCPEGWGLEIEDEKTFEMIKEKYKSIGK